MIPDCLTCTAVESQNSAKTHVYMGEHVEKPDQAKYLTCSECAYTKMFYHE